MSVLRTSLVKKSQTDFYKMTSKSKEEFIKEYENYDDQSARKFYLQLLNEIKNSVIEGDTKNLKIFSNTIDYISCIKKYTSKLQDFFNDANNPLKNTNLVILACKHNEGGVLQHLFSSKNTILKTLSNHSGKNISLDDKDEMSHNAFYYAIRSNNVELFHILINWSNNFFNDHLEESDRIISIAYEELKLNNVPLTDEMEFSVEDKLLCLRFYSNTMKREHRSTFMSSTFEDDEEAVFVCNIEKRIELLVENIDFLKKEYSITEVDERFLLTAKFIAQYIHVLKRYLKFTYDRLPWEEIEFCLICFISSHLKRQEINLFCYAFLQKDQILYHLQNFAKKLEEVKRKIEERGMKIGQLYCNPLPQKNRENIITDIVNKNPEFKELFISYEQIKDIYSMEKINRYIQCVAEVHPGESYGQLIIMRALQVLGEHLKNTLESPNLSSATSSLILLHLAKNTKKIITDLRNSLSHVYSLFKRTDIEKKFVNFVNFSTGIQNDIKRIGDVIYDILSNRKLGIIKHFFEKIVSSENFDEIKKVINILLNAVCEKQVQENFKTTEHYKLKKFIEELRESIPDKTDEEEKMFQRIKSMIISTESKSKTMQNKYDTVFEVLERFKLLTNRPVDPHLIRTTKFFAGIALMYMDPAIDSHCVKQIAELSMRIFASVESKQRSDNFNKIKTLAFKIFCIAAFKTKDIQWIKDFEEKLDPNIVSTSSDKQSNSYNATEGEYKTLLKSKQSELKNILNSHFLNDELVRNFSVYKNDKKLQTVIEMLVLDIMLILDKNHKLENNYLFLDDGYPSLTGKCLRNYLAHDNVFVALLTDPSMLILLNARKLKNVIISKGKIGNMIKDDPSKLGEKNVKCLKIIENKKRMFDALEEGNMEILNDCLRLGTDVSARNTDLWTTLHFAAKGQSLDTLKFVHDQNSNANVKNVNGHNPLHFAAASGMTNNVKYLIEKAGLSIIDAFSFQNSPLHVAAQNGYKETVEFLLKYTDDVTYIRLWRLSWDTPLDRAIKNNHIAVVNILLEKNKNFEINLSRNGFTPLHEAAECGQVKILQLLLNENADINARSSNDVTPLHQAALAGYRNTLDVLLSNGAVVDVEDTDGCTPLHYAINHNNEDIVRILLQHEAKVNATHNTKLYTPLHLASQNGFDKIAEALLEYDAVVKAKTLEGKTPLHVAVEYGHLNLVCILLKNGADIHATDELKRTPLFYAAIEGHERIAEYLIKNGAKVNVKDLEKATPLCFAVKEGLKSTVKLLIEKKANLKGQYLMRQSLLHVAVMAGNIDIIDFLIRNGADVDNENDYGFTPLHEATLYDHKDHHLFLTTNKTKINIRDSRNLTPLYKSAVKGNKDIVNILIQNKAKVNYKSDSDDTPLHLAVDAGNLDVVKILIANDADVNAKRNINPSTPLLSAIEHNHKEIVDILIAEGADVNGENGEPLFMAVIAGYSNLVTKLLDKNAKIDLKCTNDFTVLHYAAKYGHKNIVNILTGRKARVNVVTINKLTPLHFAAQEGYEDIVQVLIEEGADVKVSSGVGVTPLHLAAERGHTHVFKILLKNGAIHEAKDGNNITPLELAIRKGHFEVVKTLLQGKKMDVNVTGYDSLTALHIASQGCNFEIVKFLVKYGSDIDARDSSDSKPIHIAARNGFKDAVKFFLDQNSDVNDICKNNRTVLHCAVEKNRLEIVKLLIDREANVNVKDVNGLSPLHIAAGFGYKDIVEVLLKNGAAYNAIDSNCRKPLAMANDENVRNFLSLIGTFYKAVKNNNVIEIKRCIDKGVIVGVKNHLKGTPLHFAAWKGYDTVVPILLENNANPNIKNYKGFTPLHFAVSFSHMRIVKLLLSHGAIFDAVSDNGRTPIDLSKDADISNLLKLVSELFSDIKHHDPVAVNKLGNIKGIDTMKAIMCACNRDHQTLIIFAIQKNFPETERLKEVLHDGVSDLVNEALTLTKDGYYEKALSILENVLDKRGKILGQFNPGTLDIKREIALIFYKQGRNLEALRYFEAVFEKLKDIMGSNNQDILYMKYLIALLELSTNEGALNICKEIYPRQENILEPNHRYFLNNMLNFALVLTAQGKYEEALNTYRADLEKLNKISGPKSLYSVRAQSNLALVFFEQGKYEEALKHQNEVLERQKELHETNHVETLKTRRKIAEIFAKQNKHKKSLKILQEIEKVQKSALEPNHPEILTTQYYLLKTHFDQGRFISVLYLCNEIFNQMKEHLGQSHIFVTDILYKIKEIRLMLELTNIRIEKLLKQERDYILTSDFRIEEVLQEVRVAYDSEIDEILQEIRDNIFSSNIRIEEILQRVRYDFIVSASNGDLITFLWLIRHGADTNDKDNDGRTPLHYASSNGHTDIVNILLENGVDVTQITNKGNTSLHIAALKTNRELVEIFLKHVNRDKLGDFINAKTISSGNTALHVACQKGSLEIVDILLKYGAFYDIENNEFKKPLDLSTDTTVTAFLKLIDDLFEDAEKGDKRIVEKLKGLKKNNVLAVRNAQNKARKTLIQISNHKNFAQKIEEILHNIK